MNDADSNVSGEQAASDEIDCEEAEESSDDADVDMQIEE